MENRDLLPELRLTDEEMRVVSGAAWEPTTPPVLALVCGVIR